MKNLTFTFLAVLLLAAVCPTAVGQAVVEYGLGAGRAATTAAPARNAASGISGVFDSLSKAAGAEPGAAAPGSAAQTPEPRRTASPKTNRRTQAKQSAKPVEKEAAVVDPTPKPTPPAPAREDPRQIQAGIGYDEMLRRFGPPSMSATTGAGRSTVWYSSRDANYQIELQDGKVIVAPGTKPE